MKKDSKAENVWTELTIIIPVEGNIQKADPVIQSIKLQTWKPYKIIIVNVNCKETGHAKRISSEKEMTCNEDGLLKTIIQIEEILKPGAARNVGIEKVSTEYLAFLDVNTFPGPYWIENGMIKLAIEECKIYLGKVQYYGLTYLDKLIIASTYGFKPLQTLPGSIMQRGIIERTGYFIPNIRSGEDVEWKNRLMLLTKGSEVTISEYPISYIVKGKNLMFYLNKWSIYYFHSAFMPEVRNQRYLLYCIISTVSITLSWQWNNNVANWDESSILYLPNITKLTLGVIVGIYIIYRGIFLPIQKGALGRGGKLHWSASIWITLISIAFDTAKTMGFTTAVLKLLSPFRKTSRRI